MNYDQARALTDGGWHWTTWHWTTMNDGGVRAAWPCLEVLRPFDHEQPYQPLGEDDVKRCPPHATRQEAERHFYEACLEAVSDHEVSHWQGCAVCDVPTKHELGNNQLARIFRPIPLCDEHRTREQLRELSPFQPDHGIFLMHS